MTAPVDPLIGALLDGRYRIDRLLGRGGMGRVYRAEHVGIGRIVAVKLLDPRGGVGREDRQRFEREAIATGRLRHPNCVAVTDSGSLPDGGLYLVMELLDGQTLDDVLDATPRLSVARAVHIIAHVLRGLAHAHGLGVVHRDLTPRNIVLVARDGDPDFAKVLDFGLARLLEAGGSDQVTRTGMVCGTPQYMSPEQCLGRPLDHRADLYAVSVLLFELLAGRAPFVADESLQVLAMHTTLEPPRIAELAPDAEVPPALERLVRRGLAKRADDRPASAQDYLDELERCLRPAASRQVAATVPLLPTPPRPPRRGRVGRVLGIAALFVAVAVGLAVARSQSAHGDAAVAPAARPVEPLPALAPPTVAAPAHDPEIDVAVRMAASGRREAAAARLRALRREHPADATVPYQLGNVYAALGWPKPALESYRDAVHLDAAYRADPALIGHVTAMLASRSAWQAASRFLERELGEAAVPAIAVTARDHESGVVRARAASLLRRITAR